MRIGCVLTDLDGTLLEHGGVLGAEARAAISRLRGLGVPVVPDVMVRLSRDGANAVDRKASGRARISSLVR